jgi:capsid assembly protease
MKGYQHILSAVIDRAWAMRPAELQALASFLQTASPGDPDLIASMKAHSEAFAARVKSAAGMAAGKGVALIPVSGVILQSHSEAQWFGGTGVDWLTAQLRSAMDDSAVGAVVFDINSPGGTVSGVPELASEILASRKIKPSVAVSDGLCASAAYFLGCACTEIVSTPSSLTGSIGVYAAHIDVSKMMENFGVKVTMISYGENKTAGNPYEPLSDAARSDMQERVDYYGDMFDGAVAKSRKITKADVASKLGQGKVFNALKAKSSGMVDSIGTLDDVLSRFGVSRGASSSASALAAEETPEAEREDAAATTARAHRERELELLSLNG